MDLFDDTRELETPDRKQTVLTDENYDQEFERICDENGYFYGQNSEFVEKLPEGFCKQINDKGCEEWCKTSVAPNLAIDASSAIKEYYMAYEFANGFIVIYERSSMYD